MGLHMNVKDGSGLGKEGYGLGKEDCREGWDGIITTEGWDW